jgi:hypothetical protein
MVVGIAIQLPVIRIDLLNTPWVDHTPWEDSLLYQGMEPVEDWGIAIVVVHVTHQTGCLYMESKQW